MRLIAVDAGGSTCRVLLQDGAARHEARLGAANVTSDFSGALTRICAGLTEVAKQAGLAPEALREVPAYLALAGVTGPEIAARVTRALPLARAQVEEDRHAALVGALGGGDGTIAGIGTGSFLARQADGVFRTIGGHGLVLGDEASGAWLGRGLLARALRAADGLVPRTPLCDTLLDELGGPAGAIAFAATATPGDFAHFAPRILRTDDPAASALLARGAAYLAGALRALGWKDGETLCLIGGVAPAYAPRLPPNLRSALAEPQGSALDGALTLARRLAEAQP